ncbi:dTDP-4-dehydrorhamnose reductase [Rhizobium metallidurans]|uniref:dTDP-4-dehydrorhamnose reductase n=1 Tax=Rhizobium metallidurans TaxID=1265931 RepID=A0A7W6GDN8_9HYPH|nr:dTDP-4-dehydrorhamnose reductase [Rhizobium metallidurans]MBB3967270.1 dTDP-4-dehydrorhamnose reductase [Rhizobium metallidurans]
MKFFLVGASGQVGWQLRMCLARLGEVVAPSREAFDLMQPDPLANAIRAERPDWIINAAAYTGVDAAERNSDLAFALNAEAPRHLAVLASEIGALLVHFSTDYVFDGNNDSAYTESDPTGPLNVYGASKLEGERAIRAFCEHHLIFRTSWIYSRRRTNFLLTMERLLAAKKEVCVVCDQIGAPTSANDLAVATTGAIEHIVIQPKGSDLKGFWGTYNLTCSGETSWHGFAEAIRDRIGQTGLARVLAVSTREYNATARRPQNSRLSNEKFNRMFGFGMPDWQSALESFYQNGENVG